MERERKKHHAKWTLSGTIVKTSTNSYPIFQFFSQPTPRKMVKPELKEKQIIHTHIRKYNGKKWNGLRAVCRQHDNSQVKIKF